ncbi:metallophosphoesterase [Lysinibacillus mangiferihumi]|uniref:Metallophosphoesterase n=1 Tax=Lysinibacillus mangiferihumi TaxID=1130819 RepID=A0A4U2Z3J5_9BACI|nr:metallophosphoesterase [Lysinibacillus mangiferihumi]TKI68040.1 metallophosphoesterase [Lysinibacillus mangiferihumi]
MAKIVAGFVVLSIYSALTFYLGWGIKQWLVAMNWFHYPIFYWLILYIVSFGIIIGRLHESLRVFSVIGNYWMFIFEYGLLLCLTVQLVMWLTPFHNIRIIGSLAVAIFFILWIFGSYFAYSPVVRHLNIVMDQKDSELSSMRVVVASDFHLGVLSNKKHLQRFVKLSNEAEPDVVFLAGDIVDDDPKWFVQEGMAEVMKQLTATYGVYGVLGNHEYYGKKIAEFVEEMKKAGVKILRDETIRVNNAFIITGQEDKTNKERKHLEALKLSDQLPWFVMNHTPDDLTTPARTGVDLHMSGHTHKGQLWPNHYITARVFELDYGYKLKGQMHTLVSSGFGFWGPPMRIGSRSELWVVDITFQ